MTNYSKEFKWQVVQEVLQGQLTKDGARRKYGIKGKSSVLNWIRRFEDSSAVFQNDSVILDAMKKNSDDKKRIQDLEKELEQLKSQLQYANLKAATMEKVIEIAERDLKIEIRKKPGTKRSKK